MLDTEMRILVTGAGGVAGVNFVRALNASPRGYHLVGTDYSKYYIEIPELEARYLTPRHDSPEFVPKVALIAKKENVRFIHAQPSSEALVLSEKRATLPAPVFLPEPSVMRLGQDKLATQQKLSKASVPVAVTVPVSKLEDVDKAFDTLNPPVWLRARHGAGGRLSLPCGSREEAKDWIDLWVRKGTQLSEFIVQEYLPGRNIAWDSLWDDGKLVTSYCRERIEYPFKHISPSGITGTPSVARTVHDSEVNRVGEKSVRAIARKPNGAFSVDIKEDSQARPVVSEVDSGKFHTTMPLWGYVAFKHFGLPWYSNLADLYVRIGLGEDPPADAPEYDLLPAGYYMIRNMDSGVLLWREDGWKERVL
jgi:carbamoyl-phosphate synthase large subunit